MTSSSIIKSQNDHRDYRAVELDNKIVCLLICDPDADKSAASLDVNIGSVHDPDHINGLAHFLEHMLFMGTEKYPVQNDYASYISANSGRNNAATSLSDTYYYLDCSNAALYGALDRFAQFFIKPLFDTSCIEREMNAVDSEFQKNFMVDARRKYQIFRSSALKGNPYNKFSTGNKITLDIPNIRNDLLTFYHKYYSSNLMRLAVYGKESLDTLEKWVRELFTPVKNINLEPPRVLEMPFTSENLGDFWKIFPMTDKDIIELVWIIPTLCRYYKSSPGNYLSHLIGHEGPNSLLSYLIDEGLALTLSAGFSDELRLFTKFTVSIQLTKKGLKDYKEVCRAVFQYLKMLRSKEPELRIFEEIKKMYTVRFDYKDKEQPMNYVLNISKNMQYYPVEEVLKLGYFMEEFNPELIKSVLNSLTAQNMRIILLSKSLEKECTQQEKWYGTKYTSEPLSPDYQTLFDNPNLGPSKSNKVLDLPPTNIFIPENFEIFAMDHDSLPQYPQKLYTSDSIEVWHKQDNTFKVPKAYVCVKIYSTDCGFGVELLGYRLLKLWVKVFKESLRETLYLAHEASLSVSLDTDSQGLEITISGFNDSINKIATDLFMKIKEFDPSPFREIFDNIKVKTIKDLKNFFKKPPYEQLSVFRNNLIRKGGDSYHPDEEIRVTEEISFEDLLDFNRKFFRTVRMDAFFIGNFTKDNVTNISKSLEHILLSLRDNAKKLPKDDIPEVRIVDVYENTTWFYEHLIKPSESGDKETNSAITCVFQYGPESPYTRMQLAVLSNYLHEPCFGTLRTTEQLGYIVSSGDVSIRSVLHYTIQVQSAKKGPQYLSQRVLALLNSMKEKVAGITEEEFQKYVQSVRIKVAQKDLSILQEGGRYWNQISSHKYEFDRKEVNLRELDKLKREDFIEIFNSLFEGKRKLLEVHLVSPNHAKDYETMKEQRSKEEGKTKRIVSNEWFKRVLPLYPDFNSQF